MDRKKLFNILSFVSNLIIFGIVTWAVAFYFYIDVGAGNMRVTGVECFKFFTVDSNILLAIASGIYLYFNINRLMGKEIETPNWLKIFKYVATNAGAITFFVVLFFLMPGGALFQDLSPSYFYEDNCMVLHGFAPILGMLTLILFEKEDRIERKFTYLIFIPPIIYGIVYFACVVFAKVWEDFYGFTFGGRLYLAPLAAIAVLAIAYGADELLYFLQKLCINKLKDKKNVE